LFSEEIAIVFGVVKAVARFLEFFEVLLSTLDYWFELGKRWSRNYSDAFYYVFELVLMLFE